MEDNLEHWEEEVHKCITDIEYYYKNYVLIHDFRDIDEQLIKTYWENKLKNDNNK